MRSILATLLVGTLASLCIADDADLTVEQVAADPAKYEGKAFVFKGVAVSGNMVEGSARYRLTVKTKGGTLIDTRLKPDGMNFAIPKDQLGGMFKGFKPDVFYPVTLTCKIERSEKDHWMAVVTQLVGAPGTLTGKWKGKYLSGIHQGVTWLDLAEATDGKFHGTWTSDKGTAPISGVHTTTTKFKGTSSYGTASVSVTGKLLDRATSLTLNWTGTGSRPVKGEALFKVEMPAPSPSASPIVLEPKTLPEAKVGVAYQQKITAGGGKPSYKFSVSEGPLPAGLMLSPEGVLSGTPTASGPFVFTVSVNDSSKPPGPLTGTQNYRLRVQPEKSIVLSPTSLPNARVGADYNLALTPTGGTGPYTFALADDNELPEGLSLAPNGVLSGTPSARGTSKFSISVKDSRKEGPNTDTWPYTLTVEPDIAVSPSSGPEAQVQSLEDTHLHGSYTQTFTASGGKPPYKFSISTGQLPDGVSLSPEGVLSGTPTAKGTFTFTVTASESSTGSGPFTGSQAYTVKVAREPGFWGWVADMNQRWDSLNSLVKGGFGVLTALVLGFIALKVAWKGPSKKESAEAPKKE